jgi:hypothetical protein
LHEVVSRSRAHAGIDGDVPAVPRGPSVTGFYEYNASQREHGEQMVSMTGYLGTGHPWEALFENWESEAMTRLAADSKSP